MGIETQFLAKGSPTLRFLNQSWTNSSEPGWALTANRGRLRVLPLRVAARSIGRVWLDRIESADGNSRTAKGHNESRSIIYESSCP